VLYDYIGCNPSKGGLFRSGPILKADGVVQNWLGHASFSIGTFSITVRRMPAFFETFPVILIDQGNTVRADIPFRRAESRFSIEQRSVVLYFSGGILSATEYSTPSSLHLIKTQPYVMVFISKRLVFIFTHLFVTLISVWSFVAHQSCCVSRYLDRCYYLIITIH
jgi:Photosystem II protein